MSNDKATLILILHCYGSHPHYCFFIWVYKAYSEGKVSDGDVGSKSERRSVKDKIYVKLKLSFPWVLLQDPWLVTFERWLYSKKCQCYDNLSHDVPFKRNMLLCT